MTDQTLSTIEFELITGTNSHIALAQIFHFEGAYLFCQNRYRQECTNLYTNIPTPRTLCGFDKGYAFQLFVAPRFPLYQHPPTLLLRQLESE